MHNLNTKQSVLVISGGDSLKAKRVHCIDDWIQDKRSNISMQNRYIIQSCQWYVLWWFKWCKPEARRNNWNCAHITRDNGDIARSLTTSQEVFGNKTKAECAWTYSV